jgi:hypothetical protein
MCCFSDCFAFSTGGFVLAGGEERHADDVDVVDLATGLRGAALDLGERDVARVRERSDRVQPHAVADLADETAHALFTAAM